MKRSIAAAALITLAQFCCIDSLLLADEARRTWKSESTGLSIAIPAEWEIVSKDGTPLVVDTAEKLLISFVGKDGPYGYILKITAGVSAVSKERFFDVIRKQHGSHPAYTLLDEKDVAFHGASFRRFRFRIEGDGNETAMFLFLSRNGYRVCSIQFTFPCDDFGRVDVPQSIRDMDRGVVIDTVMSNSKGG